MSSQHDLDAMVNRDAARSALAVFRCASERDDVDPLYPMQCAIAQYHAFEERAGVDCRFHRTTPEKRISMLGRVADGLVKRGVPLLLALGLFGCAASPMGASRSTAAVPCEPESMACFRSEATLTVNGQPVEVIAWSEDLPTPGYENRWHYVLPPEAAAVLSPYLGVTTTSTVDGGAVIWPSTGQGGQFMEAVGYWRLEMRPTDPGVAQQCADLAGAREKRVQPWRVLVTNGSVEILIEESR